VTVFVELMLPTLPRHTRGIASLDTSVTKASDVGRQWPIAPRRAAGGAPLSIPCRSFDLRSTFASSALIGGIAGTVGSGSLPHRYGHPVLRLGFSLGRVVFDPAVPTPVDASCAHHSRQSTRQSWLFPLIRTGQPSHLCCITPPLGSLTELFTRPITYTKTQTNIGNQATDQKHNRGIIVSPRPSGTGIRRPNRTALPEHPCAALCARRCAAVFAPPPAKGYAS